MLTLHLVSIYAFSLVSITDSTPGELQMLTISNPTESKSPLHCPSVLSIPHARVIIMISSKAGCRSQPTSGRTNSLMSSLEYSFSIALTVFPRSCWHFSSDQSCRMPRKRYRRAPRRAIDQFSIFRLLMSREEITFYWLWCEEVVGNHLNSFHITLVVLDCLRKVHQNQSSRDIGM